MNDERMTTPDYYLAQVNIARMKAPLDDPLMEGLAAWLGELNALAESSEGFAWRLQPDTEDEPQTLMVERDGLLLDVSVWTSVEALKSFVEQGAYLELMEGGARWFEKADSPALALWWVPVKHRPGADEALLRLDRLEMVGPGPNAFTFAQLFPAPVKRRPDADEDSP